MEHSSIGDIKKCDFTSYSNWCAAWKGVGVEVASLSVYEELLGRYAEQHRAYHTCQHLAECLSLFENVKDGCSYPWEVALAIWFHDVIYDTARSDNELLSADWFKRVANEVNVAAEATERIVELILMTRHNHIAQGIDAQILVDIDLAILGAPLPRFEEYERQVRFEYQWVPDTVYRKKRKDILQSFLGRNTIYCSPYFQERFEEKARINLKQSIVKLQK